MPAKRISRIVGDPCRGRGLVDVEVLTMTSAALTLRHRPTGHVFTYHVEAGDLVLGPVQEGPGPKDPGDVAADVHAVAKQEAKRLKLI